MSNNSKEQDQQERKNKSLSDKSDIKDKKLSGENRPSV